MKPLDRLVPGSAPDTPRALCGGVGLPSQLANTKSPKSPEEGFQSALCGPAASDPTPGKPLITVVYHQEWSLSRCKGEKDRGGGVQYGDAKYCVTFLVSPSSISFIHISIIERPGYVLLDQFASLRDLFLIIMHRLFAI